MKRRVCKTLAVVLGLWLGWSAAGWATQASAESDHGPANKAAKHDDHAGHAEHAEHATGADQGHGDHQADLGQTTAGKLVPQLHELTWVQPVLGGAVSLFIAAVVIGIPALRLRGPEAPDPAAAHDDHHDDHSHGGHDDHGHGHAKADHGHGKH